jgi:hypothetical protein
MKITRQAFLYLEGQNATFAQCGSCAFGWQKCAIMGDAKVSAPKGSCNFYIKGAPTPDRKIASLTREATGYVERPVRCENCRFYGQGQCGLYRNLNKSMGAVFELEEKVDRHGCCNANEER